MVGGADGSVFAVAALRILSICIVISGSRSYSLNRSCRLQRDFSLCKRGVTVILRTLVVVLTFSLLSSGIPATQQDETDEFIISTTDYSTLEDVHEQLISTYGEGATEEFLLAFAEKEAQGIDTNFPTLGELDNEATAEALELAAEGGDISDVLDVQPNATTYPAMRGNRIQDGAAWQVNIYQYVETCSYNRVICNITDRVKNRFTITPYLNYHRVESTRLVEVGDGYEVGYLAMDFWVYKGTSGLNGFHEHTFGTSSTNRVTHVPHNSSHKNRSFTLVWGGSWYNDTDRQIVRVPEARTMWGACTTSSKCRYGS